MLKYRKFAEGEGTDPISTARSSKMEGGARAQHLQLREVAVYPFVE